MTALFVDPARRRDKAAPADLRDLEAAWTAYCAAATKAQTSGSIADGVAAGRCWRRWLRLFETG